MPQLMYFVNKFNLIQDRESDYQMFMISTIESAEFVIWNFL